MSEQVSQERAGTPRGDGRGAAAVESQATRVTFFEDRAEVQRRARARVPAGVSFVEVEGVTALCDDPSLVAGIRGEAARVIAAKVQRRVLLAPAMSDEEVQRAEAALLAARAGREAAERALQRTRAEAGRIQALLGGWLKVVARVPRGGAEGVRRFRAAYGSLDEATRAALLAVHEGVRAMRNAREEEARAELALKEGRRHQPRRRTVVELQVEAQREGEVEIDLSYRTPCALWRPEHLAQLSEGAGASELRVRSYAAAWQATGEVWRDVECRFSTARPAQSASPPLLSDDWLMLRRKTEAEQRALVVEAREQSIAVAGLAGGGRAVDEMPGVEDGGEPLWFTASQRATLPADGRPVRLEIGEVKVPALVELVAYPERGPGAHLKATATLTGSTTPLLAGPVRVLRGGELCGHGRLMFVARGEPFELGFGVDDGLRLRRAVEEARDQTAVLGTQKVTRTVRVYVSNLAGAARRLLVTERVPVSEIEEVRVTLLSAGGGHKDEKDGFLRFDVEVAPGATRELSYSYRIDAAAKVVLPF